MLGFAIDQSCNNVIMLDNGVNYIYVVICLVVNKRHTGISVGQECEGEEAGEKSRKIMLVCSKHLKTIPDFVHIDSGFLDLF